ncbi:MAG: Gfo/Idh/MocA family oxidoreductase [Micromonosporaceae bacterium]|nr:Gfo/Idh/MocA family oxidoreductase [Micromonosporaceae bacterium]
MSAGGLAVDHADTSQLVALADVNPVRMAACNRQLARWGAPPAATYPAGEFVSMLDKERVDAVVVATVDRTHDEYIVAALEAGRDVITEKPMTVDVERCRRILDAARRCDRRVTVTFNYRYNPVHEKVRELLADGAIGEIGSVHFEWLLDTRHGADYFRRWHREKVNSGGLLVHKATHHFDLVNWWLGAAPVEVYAYGRLFFYGPEAGARHGYARDYERAHGAPAAADDPFALRLDDNPRLRELYLDAEHIDGYYRDRNVFAPGVTIEDDMAVLVRYTTGATMTYHLTAYAPWEGYRIAFNGSRGRLELEVVESDHVSPGSGGLKGGGHQGPRGGEAASASLHGAEAPPEQGWVRLQLRPFWQPPVDVEIPGLTREGHGGADARMTAALFGGESTQQPSGSSGPPPADPLGRRATERDGAKSLLTGLAANASLERGQPVRVADLLNLEEL